MPLRATKVIGERKQAEARDQQSIEFFLESAKLMTELNEFLREKAINGLLPTACMEEARDRFELSHSEIERHSLEERILPSRYQRNSRTITVEQQLKLFRSRVAVVGCGGLGGYIIEELARIGIGEIITIDPDVFEDHNLNRQLFSSLLTLGQAKTEAAAKRISEINPAVTVKPIQTSFSSANETELFAGVGVVADAVDNVSTRLEMAEACERLNIPLVHAAIAGWYGHVCTIFPGEKSLQKIYQNYDGGTGIEQDLGNPAFTPAVVAGFEVAEICKILLGKKGVLRNRKLTIDLLNMEIEEIAL